MADLLSAVSVLLVFLTFLFNGIDKEVNESLQKQKPDPKQKVARKTFQRNLTRLLYLKLLPVATIFFGVFYSLLPEAVNIICISRVDFWNFNELNTIFIFIVVGLLGLGFYAMAKIFELVRFIRL
jgi:hypothetical protein